MKELLDLIQRLDLANGLPYLLAARAGTLVSPPIMWLLWEEEGLVEADRLTPKGERVLHHIIGLAEALDIRL